MILLVLIFNLNDKKDSLGNSWGNSPIIVNFLNLFENVVK